MKEKAKEILEPLRYLGLMAQQLLEDTSLRIVGLYYYVEKRPKTKGLDMHICFDTVTHDPNFFTRSYSDNRRIRLKDFVARKLKLTAGKLLYEYADNFGFDVYVCLRKPYNFSGSLCELGFINNTQLNSGKEAELTLWDFHKLLADGEIERKSKMNYYCEKYGLDHILKQANATISPDSSSVEALEAICSFCKVSSILEIGGGVGVCIKAAKLLKINDYTVVDKSSLICDYLNKTFDVCVINKDAFDFNFDRHWDLVLLGMNYELNPWFLSKSGFNLTSHCSTVIAQSGILGLFKFEHDWINERPGFSQWPWFDKKQTLPFYFPIVFSKSLDEQLLTIATHDSKTVSGIEKSMEEHGFVNAERNYNYLTL